MRPSTPPLALISSAAICAACGIDEPATACASAITPILIGAWSAAAAGSAIASARAAEAAPNAPRRGAARAAVTGDGVILVLPRISIGVDRRSAWPHHLAPWAKAAVFALPMQADFSPKARRVRIRPARLKPRRTASAREPCPPKRMRSRSARAESARLRASPRSGPARRLPASSNRGSTIKGKRPKLTFIGWNERGPGVDQFDVAPGDVIEQRADRGRRRRRLQAPLPAARRRQGGRR